jgi:2-oxoglutarate ferredoxin oxidoreductase subunit gamma
MPSWWKRWFSRAPATAPPDDRLEICLSGSGGQGIILAGVVLAKAAALHDGKNAVQTQSYGPESRGGASACEVVISSGAIDYPKLMKIDLLLALTQEALKKQLPRVRPGGTVLVDSLQVKEIPAGRERAYAVPFTQLAVSELKNGLVANVIALGTLVGVSGVVTRSAVKAALAAHVREKFREINLLALERGFEEADRLMKAGAA